MGRLLCDCGGVGSWGELGQGLDGAISKAGQSVGQILANGDTEFSAALDDAEEGGDLWARLFASQVQPVFSSNGYRSHRILRPVGR